MAPSVQEIQSTKQLDDIISGMHKDQLMVIDFHAVWCGPCKAIAPVIYKLADKYQDAIFVKVDVDQQTELAQRYSITAMPTFKLIKAGSVVDELRGASPPALAKLIAKHSSTAPTGDADVAAEFPDLKPPMAAQVVRGLAFLVAGYYVWKWLMG